MTKIVGVRFRPAGKVYYFDPAGFPLESGSHVIVETARGVEFGTVIIPPKEVEDSQVVQPLKPVLRIASEEDEKTESRNKEKEKGAYKICQEKIQKHGLEMKLVDAEYTFDNNKVLFYFTADGRIDFRELVKDLASVFKTRIELRQIGVRDETKIMGGIGICGRPLCCHSYLSEFIPVSIKMAKEQNLSLNPTKISGVCGRLMCCLKHEEDTYEELNRRLPGIGDFVTTEDGLKGQVQSVNVLRQLVKVVVDKEDEKEILEYPVEELRFRRRHSKKEQMELSKEELQELERMEQEDQLESREEQSDSRDGKQERSDRFGEAGAEKRERQERPVRTGRERAGRDRRQEHGQRQQESGERQRYSREGSQDRSERYSREGNQDRSERYSREGNQDRSERYSREGGQDRSERYSREGSQDRSERYSREGGQSRRGRYERGEGNTRRDRGSDRREYQENRPERQGRGERQERGENRRRGDSHSHRQGTPGNRPRRERSDHEWEQND